MSNDTTDFLIGVLGMLLGLGVGGTLMYLWGYHNGHLDGYQDHRAEVIELKNAADARRAPRGELEIRSKTAPLAAPVPWYRDVPTAAPGGGRPFPIASPRLATTVDDIGPVVVPKTGTTVIPFRPQPPRDSGPGTAIMPRLTDSGALRALADRTEDLITRMRAGTWPPN